MLEKLLNKIQSKIELSSQKLIVKNNLSKCDRLIFKDNLSAFQYACEYLDTLVEEGKPIIGIILEEKKDGDYCVKLSNPNDSQIPTNSFSDLNNINYICPAAIKLESVNKLSSGDLVMWEPAPFNFLTSNHYLAGVIVAKIKPQYDLERTSWIIDS